MEALGRFRRLVCVLRSFKVDYRRRTIYMRLNISFIRISNASADGVQSAFRLGIYGLKIGFRTFCARGRLSTNVLRFL